MDIQAIGYNNFRQKYIKQTSKATWCRLKKELDNLLNNISLNKIFNNQCDAEDILFYIKIVLLQ
jgi:hypothetical protein